MGTLTEHAPDIDYKFEYTEARRLMGLKSTDLMQLQHCVIMLYLNCPDDLHGIYLALVDEIEARQLLTDKF